MKVAICDDSEQDIADLKEKLLKIIEGQIENCEIHVYTDVTKFLKEIHTISFDGIFLDIDMPQMTGIQAAQRVREALPDVGLVFVSSCESMVFEAIKTTPLRFIRKARLEEELEEAAENIHVVRHFFFRNPAVAHCLQNHRNAVHLAVRAKPPAERPAKPVGSHNVGEKL